MSLLALRKKRRKKPSRKLQEKYEEIEQIRNLMQYDIVDINGDTFNNYTRGNSGIVVEQ